MAVSTAANLQYLPQIVSDGSGGAIIIWHDGRSGNYDIYAQRLNSTGTPQWTANGLAVSTAAWDQHYTQIASDGAGGAIITWQDIGSGTTRDIYAQRLNASGIPQWTADGVAVSTAAWDQHYTQIASDGAGGAIITWQDIGSGTTRDIYAQRLNASGVPQWTADGLAVSTAANSKYSPQIASDGSGGAIITWQDYRSGTNLDIYAQRITSLGNLGADPADTTPSPTPIFQSPANGSTVNTATPTFTWTAVVDAPSSPPVLYDLQVASSSSMSSPFINKTNLTTNTYTLLASESLASGIWYWSVRARDSASPAWNYSAWSSPAWSFNVVLFDNTPPPTPTPQSPANGSIVNTATPTFTWTEVFDAPSSPPVLYDLQVATNSAMTTPVINAANWATNTNVLSFVTCYCDPDISGEAISNKFIDCFVLRFISESLQ